MDRITVFDSEYKFCCILWECEPIKSSALAEKCREKLGWSKTTTYTVIKRLSDRNIVRNEKSTVYSLVKKEDVQQSDIDELLDKRFNGSLPAFITAFSKSHKLSDSEIEELCRIIRSGGNDK